MIWSRCESEVHKAWFSFIIIIVVPWLDEGCHLQVSLPCDVLCQIVNRPVFVQVVSSCSVFQRIKIKNWGTCFQFFWETFTFLLAYHVCYYFLHFHFFPFFHIYTDFLLLLENEDLIAAFLVVVQDFRYEAFVNHRYNAPEYNVRLV